MHLWRCVCLVLILASMPALTSAQSGQTAHANLSLIGQGGAGAVRLQPSLIVPDLPLRLSVPFCFADHRFHFYASPPCFSGIPSQFPKIPIFVADQLIWYEFITQSAFDWGPSYFTDRVNFSITDYGCQVLDPSLLSEPIIIFSPALRMQLNEK